MNEEERPDNFIDEPAPRPNPDNPFAPLTPDPAAGSESVRHRGHRVWVVILAVIVAAAGAAMWLRYFSPYITDARVSGYITGIEKRGLVFKTFEGQMITESALTDTTRVYSRDFVFSVDNDSLARVMQDFQGTGRRVTVTYKRYYGVLPWRGASRNVVTGMTGTSPVF